MAAPIAAKLVGEAKQLAIGGLSARPGKFNLESLRNFRQFKGKMKKGLAGTFDLNFIGDSYVAGGVVPGGRFITALTNKLCATLGDAGLGWTGYGAPAAGFSQVNGNARPALTALSFSGTWSDNYNGSATSPDISHKNSITPGSRIMRSFPANTASVRIFWGATSDGSNAGTARYSLDNTSTWTNFTLSGNNQGTLLVNAPSAASFDMIIEVVGTNSCRFQGDYHVSTATFGIRPNKLGGSGATATQFGNFLGGAGGRTSRYMLGGADSMDVIALGANDQGNGSPKATFKSDLEKLIVSGRTLVNANIRSTGRDLYLLMPPENNLGRAQLMSEYDQAGFELAVQYDTGYRSMQSVFGPSPPLYAFGGPYAKMAADGLHPAEDTGGADYVETVFNDLMYG